MMITTLLIIVRVFGLDIIQLTDIHYDILMDAQKYDETTSCRGKGFRMVERVKMVYKKVPKPKNPYFGIYFCDSNKNLVKETIYQTYRVSPFPGLILLSGDLAGHYQGTNNPEVVKEVFSFISNRFNGVPVIFSIGNNDVNPSYYTHCSDSRYEMYYNALKDQIPLSEKEQFLRHGTYLRHLNQFQLSVLSLNTLLFGPKLKGDDCGALEYIKNSLQLCRNKGNNVLIVGHFPLGVAAYDCKEYLNQTIQRSLISTLKENEDIIIGTVFGHDHRSEMKSMGDIVALTAPAVSPIFGNTPGFRVYSYNQNKRLLEDIKDYYMQFIQSNIQSKGLWTEAFRFTELYQVPDASPQSIKKAHQKILDEEIYYLKYSSLVNGFFDPSYKSRECVMVSDNQESAEECIKKNL